MATYVKKLPRVEAYKTTEPTEINTDFGTQTIPTGWYIMTNAYGQQSAMPGDQFEAQFELAE